MPDILANDGVISVSRTQSNVRDAYVTIQIDYGSERVEVTMAVEAFGHAILGLAAQPCQVALKQFTRKTTVTSSL